MEWKEVLLACLSTYGGSILKTITGPVLSKALGLPIWTGGLLTAAGMLTPVYGLYYLGRPLRKWVLRFWVKNTDKRLFSRRRRYAKLWARYGAWGIACLTPLILTPIGGSLLAFSLADNPKRVLLPMWICALFWGMLLSYATHIGADQLLLFIKRL